VPCRAVVSVPAQNPYRSTKTDVPISVGNPLNHVQPVPQPPSHRLMAGFRARRIHVINDLPSVDKTKA
jgi:hypothetical protein